MKEFDRQNVTDQDMVLIGLLGKTVSLRWKNGELILTGILHTYNITMKYFSVTKDWQNQHVFTYFEVDHITSDNQIFLTI